MKAFEVAKVQVQEKIFLSEEGFVWNIKKLGETIDADFDVFKVRCAVCEEVRTTTAGFARVERSSKILQRTSYSTNLENLICLLE